MYYLSSAHIEVDMRFSFFGIMSRPIILLEAGIWKRVIGKHKINTIAHFTIKLQKQSNEHRAD